MECLHSFCFCLAVMPPGIVTAITKDMCISPTVVCITHLATDRCTDRICTARPFTARIMALTVGLIVPVMVANGLTVGIARVDTVTADVKVPVIAV